MDCGERDIRGSVKRCCLLAEAAGEWLEVELLSVEIYLMTMDICGERDFS
jgi:hypothetical protein